MIPGGLPAPRNQPKPSDGTQLSDRGDRGGEPGSRGVSPPNESTVGVIGGMSPSATALFYEALMREVRLQLGVRLQHEYPRVLIDSFPVPETVDRMPDPALSHRILGCLQQSLRTLLTCSPSVIAMPCNTAHLYLRELRGASTAPILDIVASTLDAVVTTGARRPLLLATIPTAGGAPYTEGCARRGLDLGVPTAEEAADIVGIIRRVIAGETDRAGRDRVRLCALVERYAARDRDCVVIGCTDLSVLLADTPLALPAIDSLTELACAVVPFL